MSKTMMTDPSVHHDALAAIVTSYAAMLEGYREVLRMQGGMAQAAAQQAKEKIAKLEEENAILRAGLTERQRNPHEKCEFAERLNEAKPVLDAVVDMIRTQNAQPFDQAASRQAVSRLVGVGQTWYTNDRNR